MIDPVAARENERVTRTYRRKALRKRTLGCLVRQLQYLLVLICAALIGLGALTRWQKGDLLGAMTTPSTTPTVSVAQGDPPSAAVPPTPTATARPVPTSSSTEPCCRIGILAGHAGPQNDPGAMCDDGLREADINLKVARAVVATLERRGYSVDLLEEFDSRLDGYVADVFLSIHSDSCQVPEASGFKVARVSNSAIPDVEDALVDCLNREYQRTTSLQRHDFSITRNMHQYHAFSKIDPQTPGAIIELGFLAADRELLVKGDKKMVEGIVAGILCFLEPRASGRPGR